MQYLNIGRNTFRPMTVTNEMARMWAVLADRTAAERAKSAAVAAAQAAAQSVLPAQRDRLIAEAAALVRSFATSVAGPSSLLACTPGAASCVLLPYTTAKQNFLGHCIVTQVAMAAS